MFCTNCGKQLADEARFCTSCGTAVGEVKKELVARAASAGAPDGAVASVGGPASAGDSAASAVVGATGVSSDDSASAVAAVASAAGSDAKAAKPVNFKAAMDSTKARGKRRMPTIVLVALALALTSAVAFAAHYVYTGYIAPALEESGINAPFYHGPVDEAEERASIYQLYNQKVQEYIHQYGEPGVEWPSGYGWAVGHEWYLTGLCFVDLVDFGDGVERLVCAYYDKEKDTTGDRYLMMQAYILEVWQPDSSGGIEKVHSGTASSIGNGGYFGMELIEAEGETYLHSYQWAEPGELPGTEVFESMVGEAISDSTLEVSSYWGLAGDSFELRKTYASAMTDDFDFIYAEDGEIVEETTIAEWWDKSDYTTYYFLGYEPEAKDLVIEVSNETIAELAELASAQPALESEEESAQPVDLKAVNAAYDEWLAANGPAGKMEARIDMDDNGVPELLIYLGQHVSEIYTYENGEVVEVTNAESPDQTYRMSMEVTEDHFLFYRISANGGAVGSCVAYKVNGSSLEVQEKLSWEPVDWSSWTTSGLRFTHTTPEGTTEVVKPVDEYYFQQFEDKFTFIEDLGGQLIGS